jgi:hypothetical protein
MAMRSILACGFATVVALGAGCSRKSLQDIDAAGSGGGSVLTGAGGGSGLTGGGGSSILPIDGGGIDAPWNPPFSGRRSFVVQSQLRTEGGVSSHAFTMVVDPDHHIAIVGANGTGWAATLLQLADGTLRLDRAVVFDLRVAGACSANVRYDSLAFNVDTSSGGLTGGGQGQVTTVQGDVATSVPVTMSLTGVADTVTPTLMLTSDGSDITDPFTALWVSSPEPLPVSSSSALRAAGGDIVVMTPSPKDTFIVAFMKPNVLLRYSETYTFPIDGIADFAGNRAAQTNALTFTTKPPPPLVAADGFESVTDTTLGGAEVLSGAGAPTISGSRSLYIRPVTTLGMPPTTQLALRIAIPPGSIVLKFSYRTATLGSPATIGAQFKVASVGGSIASIILSPGSGQGTTAVIDGTTVTLGPVMTEAIALPADATDEVVLAAITQWRGSCGPPYPNPPGLIIDDLRAE